MIVTCCNLPSVLITEDEYRSKFQCIACKKYKYVLKDRNSTEGFQGKLTTLQGDLYDTCGICGNLVKYSDLWDKGSKGSQKVQWGKNGATRTAKLPKIESKPKQRVTVLIRWEQIEIPYWHTAPGYTGNKEDHGLGRGIRIVNRPILRTVPACFDCWNSFERSRPADRAALHFIQLP